MRHRPDRPLDKALDYAAGALLGALLAGTLFILVGGLFFTVILRGMP